MAPREGRGPRRRGVAISLTLTVAGSSCSTPRPDRACSGYLVHDGERSIVLDLGSGAFANLRRHADYDKLDAVIITHMHSDHFLDLVPLRYAIVYGSARRPRPLPLWLPPGGSSMLRLLASAFLPELEGDFLDEAFDIDEFNPEAGIKLGKTHLRFSRTTHYIPSFAVRVQRNGSSLTYSADTAPDDGVVDLARKTDLFLCEATLLADDVEPGMRGHCSAREAAQMAQSADAKRLILTHYAESAGPRDLAEGARSVYSGEINVADDHAVFRT